MRQCDITGKKPMTGRVIHRRGLSKKSGGIGIKTTAMNPRKFFPNLQEKRIFVPELKRYVRLKITASAMRLVKKKGAYRALVESGILKAS